MDDPGITFSWGWFWATLLGAVLGFVAGEIIEAIVTALWARRDRRKRNRPVKMPESHSPWLRRSHTKTNPR
ncbi:MAG: hypothetical protein WCO26_10265 [Deltaproteobacteria bacterium]